ncbi:MAG: LamG domain-containing protein [Candidatus Marsarchaeota archaeon]|nr:LamG domain-containing protein [Candidatus Marsarchaeota archaeon]
MEYLMTYGWAILIIAVVLGVLYQLGVFNSKTFQGKAQTGSCEVYRTSTNVGITQISLQGQCNNLYPKYVAMFSGSGSYVDIPLPSELPLGSNQRSITAWVKRMGNNGGSDNYGNIFSYGTPAAANAFGLGSENNFVSEWGGGSGFNYQSTIPVPLDSWVFVAVTYNGIGTTVYYNETPQPGGPIGLLTTKSGSAYIGSEFSLGSFTGQITNVQAYNISLDQSQIDGLYTEGIGGTPIDITNLVGWWPLDGDEQDYSGFQQNGVANDITFTAEWESGYGPAS